MEIAVVMLSVGIFATLGVLAVVVLERRPLLRRQMSRRVVVHTTESASIEGTLTAYSRDGAVLTAARYLDGDGTDLGGDTFVPAGKLHFIQMVS